MIRVAVSGSNGFIGSNFIKAAQSRFQIRTIGRDAGGDVKSLSRAIEDCDAVVHCAHDGVNESANVPYGINLVKAAKQAGVRRMVAFGTFATYENSGTTITETSPACKARIPYIVEKLRLEQAFADALDTVYPSLRLAFLQPTIVVGTGGSWDRFARRLTSTERIVLPYGGKGICNLVSVETVAAAMCAAIEASDARFGERRMLKALVTSDTPMSWLEWLGNSYGIPVSRIESCNGNAWAESSKRNLLLAFRYSAIGEALMNLRPKRPAGPPDTSSRPDRSSADTKSEERHAIYLPEGLDRLTLACRATVQGNASLLNG